MDVADLMDDEDLQKLYEDRLARLKEEQEKRAQMQRKGHGRPLPCRPAAGCCLTARGIRITCAPPGLVRTSDSQESTRRSTRRTFWRWSQRPRTS